MLSTLGLIGILFRYLWTVKVTLHMLWVLNKVVLMLMLRCIEIGVENNVL